jgi:hypothetical protein
MRDIRWVAIVLGAFVAEVLGFAVLMCIRVLHGYGPFAPDPLSAVGNAAFLIELFLVFMLFGWWIARGARELVFLNGLLVGVAAVLIYEIVARGSGASIPLSAQYLLAHAVKIGGGAAGGWIAARQRSDSAVPRAA